jgi:hypothetical protein
MQQACGELVEQVCVVDGHDEPRFAGRTGEGRNPGPQRGRGVRFGRPDWHKVGEGAKRDRGQGSGPRRIRSGVPPASRHVQALLRQPRPAHAWLAGDDDRARLVPDEVGVYGREFALATHKRPPGADHADMRINEPGDRTDLVIVGCLNAHTNLLSAPGQISGTGGLS